MKRIGIIIELHIYNIIKNKRVSGNSLKAFTILIKP